MPNIQTRVLLLTLGTTPQVVTESLYALATRPEPFVPDVIHLITTGEGGRQAQLRLLDQDGQAGHIGKLCRELGIPPPEVKVTVIESETFETLDDVRSVAHQELAANQILSLVRQLTLDDATLVHVSLAGGRKTMGFYLAYALSLFGRPQDELSHVLVNAPFESLPDFFYPPKKPVILQLLGGKTASTADAEITLAPIPYLRLRGLLPKGLIAEQHSYAQLVARTQTHISGTLHLHIEDRLVKFGGTVCTLSDSPFLWLCWFAQRAKANLPGAGLNDPCKAEVVALGKRLVGEQLDGTGLRQLERLFDGDALDADAFRVNRSRLNNELKNFFGLRTPLQIIKEGPQRQSTFRLAIASDLIHIHP